MWPDRAETEELLNRARDGDRGAVEELLTRHRESLRRLIALRLDAALARRVDASDIVQDAMLEASRRLDDYLKKPGMPFHLWLRNIGLDRLIDAHRRHRKAQRRSMDREQPMHAAAWAEQSSLDLLAALVDPELTPASAAMREELRQRFEAALTELDDDDREVIRMRHLEQLSNKELAQAYGISEPAAAMRYIRAVRRLRGLLVPGETGSGSRDGP